MGDAGLVRARLSIAGVVIALFGLVALSSWTRIEIVLESPRFDTQRADGLLRSDPGLLYYLTSRVVGARGGVPADWRADPRIEHPDVIDVPAVFSVGQEFLIAWTWRAFGGGVPLHVFCVIVMAWVASAAAFGVYGAVAALTCSRPWALAAAALFVVLPVNYRTVGFVLVREDLSLPLFALHLALLALAWRRASVPIALACGLSLGAALATWHAMTFIAAVEAACLWAWALRSGQNPFARREARFGLAALVATTIAVPVLREKVALLSPAVAIGVALLACARLRVDDSPVRRVALSLAVVVAMLWLGRVLGSADFDHVFEVMLAKVIHGGRLPDDPAELSFEARMLWQGPFRTLSAEALFAQLGLALPLAAGVGLWQAGRAAVVGRTASREQAAAGVAALFLLAGLVLGVLVARLLVLAGLMAPIVLVLGLRELAARWGSSHRLAVAVVSALIAIQAIGFARFASGASLGWYAPDVRRLELAALVEALPRFVPEDEAVTGDFVNSTAVLAHTHRPIVLQPKWERAATRERLERFWTTFYHDSPEALRRLVTQEFDSRWLLVDRMTMLRTPSSRYLAGLGSDVDELPDGSAAEWLLSTDARALSSIPGYRLVYRSPLRWAMPDGRPSDFFRLYRLDPTAP